MKTTRYGPRRPVELLVLLLGLMSVGVSSTLAQTGTITGQIVDEQSLNPLSAVQVFLPELELGALTQQNGRYILVNVPAGTHTLTTSRIGYRTVSVELAVGAGETVVQDLQMSEQALRLDEVIVTGTPGGTQRRALGNAVTRLDAAQVTERAAVANMQEMLSARTPGLDFTRMSGNIGTGSSIQLRGVSSFSLGTQPLVYIDGVRVSNNANAGPSIRGGPQSSTLDDINPEDVESVEIIKGPAAATLYGTEASAGVIQIITKRGQAGAPQVSLGLRRGVNYMADPAGRLGEMWGRNATGDLIQFNIYEHEEAVTGSPPYSNGPGQSVNMGVRGGTDAVRYFVSGDWSDDQGAVTWNTDETLSGRANVSVVFGDDLTIDVSTGFIDGATRFAQPEPRDGGVWDNMVWGQAVLLDTRLRGFQENLPEEVAQISTTRDHQRFTGGATATHTFGDWLTQRLVAGIDRNWEENQVLIPRDPAGAQGPWGSRSEGTVELSRPIHTNVSLEYSVSARYQLNSQFRFTTSLGGQYFSREVNQLDTRGQVFASPLLRNISGATQFDPIVQDFVQNKSLGFYVQEEVSFNDRVFVTGALRGDDNSAFGSEFTAAYYPKLSATWVLSEENFWNVDFIGSLRLRGAWGESGRQPDTFAGTTLFEGWIGAGGVPAVRPSNVGNPDVGPERSSEIELGFDWGVLNDRVSGEFTYYTRSTTDALVGQDLPASTGFSGSRQTNLGALDSWGWEAALTARLVDRENVALDLRLSGDHADNEIRELGENVLPSATFRTGFPFPALATDIVMSAELDTNGTAINIMCDSGAGSTGRERGGAAAPCSEVVGEGGLLVGPGFNTYTWSVAPTVTLMGDLQIFALAEGMYGRWLNSTNMWCRSFCYSNTYQSNVRTDPLYVAGVRTAGIEDRRYMGFYNADHWRLRELGARYTLPQSLIGHAGIERATLSVSGRNLFDIWSRWDTDLGGTQIEDHELTNPGSTSAGHLGQMPALSSVMVQLRVTF